MHRKDYLIFLVCSMKKKMKTHSNKKIDITFPSFVLYHHIICLIEPEICPVIIECLIIFK